MNQSASLSILRVKVELLLGQAGKVHGLFAFWLTRCRFGRKIMAVYRGNARAVTAEKTVDAAGKDAAVALRVRSSLRLFWCLKLLRQSNDLAGQHLCHDLTFKSLSRTPCGSASIQQQQVISTTNSSVQETVRRSRICCSAGGSFVAYRSDR